MRAAASSRSAAGRRAAPPITMAWRAALLQRLVEEGREVARQQLAPALVRGHGALHASRAPPADARASRTEPLYVACAPSTHSLRRSSSSAWNGRPSRRRLRAGCERRREDTCGSSSRAMAQPGGGRSSRRERAALPPTRTSARVTCAPPPRSERSTAWKRTLACRHAAPAQVFSVLLVWVAPTFTRGRSASRDGGCEAHMHGRTVGPRDARRSDALIARTVLRNLSIRAQLTPAHRPRLRAARHAQAASSGHPRQSATGTSRSASRWAPGCVAASGRVAVVPYAAGGHGGAALPRAGGRHPYHMELDAERGRSVLLRDKSAGRDLRADGWDRRP